MIKDIKRKQREISKSLFETTIVTIEGSRSVNISAMAIFRSGESDTAPPAVVPANENIRRMESDENSVTEIEAEQRVPQARAEIITLE